MEESTERLPYDAAYKAMFSFPEMVRSLLLDFVDERFVQELNFSTLERCPETHITEDLRERSQDIVWRIGWKDGRCCYVALLLEFQSTTDHWMALRILSYTALLLLDLVKIDPNLGKQGLPAVLPIVIYNGGQTWNSRQEVAELFAPMPEELKTYCPHQRYFLLDKSRVPSEQLGRNESLITQILRVDRTGDAREVLAANKNLAEILRDPRHEPLRRVIANWVRLVLKNHSDGTMEIPEFQDIKEVIVMLEKKITTWEENYKEGCRAEGRAEGKAEGRAEGKVEGRAEGRAEGSIHILLQLLEQRFGSLPQSLIESIRSLSDFNLLSHLALAAYSAESLQAFMEELPQRP